jgi:hypothetical protein
MHLTGKPYKSSKLNVRGGRAWCIPTNLGVLSSAEVADICGTTASCIHVRIHKYLRGRVPMEEIIAPVRLDKLGAKRLRNKERLRQRHAAEEDGKVFFDPESVCELPEKLWGSLAYLNKRLRKRDYRLKAIPVGSWERGARI